MVEGTSTGGAGGSASRELMKEVMMELLSEVPALKAFIDKPPAEDTIDTTREAEGSTGKLGAAARVV